MIDLERDGDVFLLTMNAGENRWNTTFVRAIDTALDEVEDSAGPAALVTTSADEKFFSNGLDLDWRASAGEHPGGDRDAFTHEFMTLMARMITFPMPTIAVINGHAFGAGMMFALCHDVRHMREDRGFVCANEMQIGFRIPTPELGLFRHKLSASAFFDTVQLSRRWTGPAARDAGFVERAGPLETLLEQARERAAALAPLGANRQLYAEQKERLYGANSVLSDPHGAAYQLRNQADYHG